MPRICDYEGSQYRTEFWENENRSYEDLAERIAVANMLPKNGKRLLEVGAGFGRLVDMYEGYDQIVLMDYARTQLEEAQKYLGHDERFIFVVADVYNMPFVNQRFDTLVMIRVMHHLVDVPQALNELERVTESAGSAIIEHASKRHLKSILRWMTGQQTWNPFDHAPHEFVELNIDFHPTWIRQQFEAAGFNINDTRTVSHYRIPFLKKNLPAPLLARLDGFLQPTGRIFQLSPSIFLKASPKKSMSDNASGFFQCPSCTHTHLADHDNFLTCANCDTRWEFRNGIYDFKTPMSVTD